MAATIDRMSKKRTGKAGKGADGSPTEGRTADRHTPGAKMGRVRVRLAFALDRLARKRHTDFTEELNRAVREMLEREGMWPLSTADEKELAVALQAKLGDISQGKQ